MTRVMWYMETFSSNLKWELRNVFSIKFWKDRWLPEVIRIQDEKITQIPKELLDIKVADCFTEEGDWDVRKFVSFLGQDLVQTITLQIRLLSEEDIPIWPHTSSGLFSVRSAYQCQASQDDHFVKWNWKKIWRLDIPQRCRMFLWKACRKGLMTNEARINREINCSSDCFCCPGVIEDALHILRDCYNVVEV